MTELNFENLKLYEELDNAIRDRIQDVYPKYAQIHRLYCPFHLNIETISLEDDSIVWFSYYDNGSDSASFPIEIMYEDNWEEKEKEKAELQEQEKIKQQKMASEIMERVTRASELEELARLKAKYEMN